MSKATPGPWVIRETHTHIAVIGANNETLFHDDKRIPGVMDDARLIAAAPDLLDFAKWVLSLNTGGLIERRSKEVIAKAEDSDAAL